MIFLVIIALTLAVVLTGILVIPEFTQRSKP